MNKIMIVVGIVVVMATLGIVFASAETSVGTSPTLDPSDTQNYGAEQTVNLALASNGYYIPNEIRTKVGTKITLIGDTTTLTGCMQTVVINGYGVSKRMLPGDNVIEFIADKPGTYSITCSMGMGVGKFIVEDEDGSVPATQEVLPAKHTCGAGGCGCGG
ncbi:MAG: cupredoxin domain-containing protein [Candidatus Micrarchaeota archaeon]